MNNLTNYNKNNHKLTEYFPIRRSERKTEKTVLQEKQRTLEQILRSEREDGLEVLIERDGGMFYNILVIYNCAGSNIWRQRPWCSYITTIQQR